MSNLTMTKKKDVLIAEDEQDIAQYLADFLKNMECFGNIIIAPDGVDATTKLLNQNFSLILLDLGLPRKKGIEILRQFKSMKHNQINDVMIISGTLDKHKVAEALSLGVRQILVKPFDSQTLELRIKQMIGLAPADDGSTVQPAPEETSADPSKK